MLGPGRNRHPGISVRRPEILGQTEKLYFGWHQHHCSRFLPALAFSNKTDLYGKNGSGNEKGPRLGKRWRPRNFLATILSGLISANARTAGLTGFSFSMNSSTDGEKWKVFGSNSANFWIHGGRIRNGRIGALNLGCQTGCLKYYFFRRGQLWLVG